MTVSVHKDIEPCVVFASDVFQVPTKMAHFLYVFVHVPCCIGRVH